MKSNRIQKEETRRLKMIDGNLWSVLVSIAFPLVIYNSISQIFGFFDSLIAATIGSDIISIVSFNSQINLMFTAMATGLAIGGGVIIARFYGAGDMEKVGTHVNTLFFLALAMSILIIIVIVPFAGFFLRLLSIPEELVNKATLPFIIDTVTILPIFINLIWFAIEKAKGNTKIILLSNVIMLTVKFALTMFFVYGLHGGIIALSLATLLANVTVSAIALVNLTAKDNRFTLSPGKADFSAKTLGNILSLSVPVFFEKFTFCFGKVMVNSMSAAWGSTVIGALGVSNRIGGLATMPPNGVQEAEASLVSQNLGAGKPDRAIGFFMRSLAINLGIGIFFSILMSVCMDPVTHLFAKGNADFAAEIRKIYNFERDAIIPIATASASMGLLYGYGYTKTAMILNMLRLFAFRIPPLWIIRTYTNMGSEGVGLAMFISNGLYGVVTTAVALVIVFRLKRGKTKEIR